MSATTSGDSARSPPANGVLLASANARKPVKEASIQALRRPLCFVSSRGNPKERKAASGPGTHRRKIAEATSECPVTNHLRRMPV